MGPTVPIGNIDSISDSMSVAKGLNFTSKEAYQNFLKMISDKNGDLMLNNKQIHEILATAERAKDAA